MTNINKKVVVRVFSYLLPLTSYLLFSCSEEESYSASTSPVVTSITTGEAAVTAISATAYGTVQDLSNMASSTYQVGAVYGTMSDPTNGGTRQIGSIDDQGNVSTAISGLTEGTTYYYATFVTLQGKVTKYGEVKSFTATDADVATLDAASITACTAVLNGQAAGISDILASSAVGFNYALTAEGVATGVDVPVDIHIELLACNCSTSPLLSAIPQLATMFSICELCISVMVLMTRASIKSPTSTATLLLHLACTDLAPRRIGDESTTSSCTRLALCSNSSATAVCMVLSVTPRQICAASSTIIGRNCLPALAWI